VLKHDLYLFSDEAYREFVYGGAAKSALELAGAEQNVIMIDTISKRYSACGARLGALVTRNKQVLNAVLKFAQARLSPPSFAQIAAEAAIDLPSNYFDATKHNYQHRRDTLVKRLNKMAGVFCPSPGGAFYAIARLPIDDCDKFCQWILESFEHQGQTVMMAPASGFYGSAGMGLNEVRLAYVLNAESIDAAMDCLEQALMVYPGRKE
jgi:aspartate aminotransferase